LIIVESKFFETDKNQTLKKSCQDNDKIQNL
jgi:hypothetical protein